MKNIRREIQCSLTYTQKFIFKCRLRDYLTFVMLYQLVDTDSFSNNKQPSGLTREYHSNNARKATLMVLGLPFC
jgi:hypothetical protein